MKKSAKAKGSKGSSKSSAAAKNELPELVAIMMRIAERLEALEKKTDLVITQVSVRSFEGREHPKPPSQSFIPSQPFRQPDQAQRPGEVKPAQGPAQGQNHGHNPERRERVLHKAVCADCHKDCEVPFKPTGERPVYCKECFSKRKGGNSFKGNHGNKQATDLPKVTGPVHPPQRQMIVTKKGVGKVTVSEIVRSSARDSSHKGKGHHKPAKKSKR
jgi:CxxC-x17-CxxC domain-containing protein